MKSTIAGFRSKMSNRARQEAQERWRETERLSGIVQVNVRAPEQWSEAIKDFVELLREGVAPAHAFEKAFPHSPKALVRRRQWIRPPATGA